MTLIPSHFAPELSTNELSINEIDKPVQPSYSRRGVPNGRVHRTYPSWRRFAPGVHPMSFRATRGGRPGRTRVLTDADAGACWDTLFAACRPAPALRLSLLAFGLAAISALPCRAQNAPSTSVKSGAAAPANAPAAVLRPAALEAEAEPELPPGTPRIGQIVIIGNKTLSQTAIALFSGHKPGDACTEPVLTEMRANIFQKGYFGMHSASVDDAVRVHVEPMEDRSDTLMRIAGSDKPEGNKSEADKSADDPNAGKRFKVIVEVDENPTIAGVSIEGAGPVKEDDVRALVHLKPGMVYNPFQFRRDYADIQELYNKRGYIVTPDPAADLDSKNNLKVALIVARVADIRVAKNHKTKAAVVLRELKTRKGEYYNRSVVQRDRVTLYNLDIFEDVTVDEHNAGPGKVALVINVPEKKSGSLLGGLSYSASQGPVGTASIVDHNFRGMGETLSLSGSLGTTSIKQHSVELGYIRPHMDKSGTKMDLSLYDKNVPRFADSLQNGLTSVGSSGQEGRFNQQRTGASLALTRPLSQTLRAGITFKGEDTRTDALTGLTAANDSIIQNGPILQIGGLLQHDTRDWLNDPVKGGYQSLNVNLGHANLRSALGAGASNPGVFGSGNFGKSFLELRQYFSLNGARTPGKPGEDKTSLAMRFLGGAGAGKMPFAEQFFLGGTDTLRGYREDRFWGNYMMMGTMEVRQPLAHSVKGVLFMDVGEAWGGEYSNVNLSGFAQSGFQPHIGAGFGLRIGTPLGPLRLDLGFGDEGARTHFGIGRNF